MSTVTLVRHGETAWSAAGRHTGRTDIPLAEAGERKACRVGERLAAKTFDRVFASPLQRAMKTCALAGFGDRAVVDPDLIEWDYGDYEGRTSHDIQSERPGWLIFRDGCPHGETAATSADASTASSPACAPSRIARSCSRARMCCAS